MEIPPNILKELEEKKMQAMLAQVSAPEKQEISTFRLDQAYTLPPMMIEANPHKKSGGEMFFDFLSKIAVYASIFLTPLLFFSSSDILNLPKQFLLSTLALVGLVSWVGKTVASGKLSWRKNIILWPLVLVILTAVFGSVFSSSFWVSFLGDAGRYSSAGLSILSYLAIALVAFQNFNKKDVNIAVILWVTSSFLAGFFALLQFFGVYILPMDIYKSRLFNTVGSPFALALFVLSVSPLLWCLIQSRIDKKIKVALALVLVSQLVVSIIVDFRVGWIGLIASALFLILMGFKKGEQMGEMVGSYQQKVLLPLGVVIFSVLMWLISAPQIKDLNLPSEIILSYSASFDILAKNLKEKPVFGSGLETYPYVYAKFKDASLNQTNYWGVNFSDSVSEIITWATTTGFFGTLALLVFILTFLGYAFRRVTTSEVETGLLASWVFILTTKFFYTTSLSLEFMFWFLPVLIILNGTKRDETGEMGWSYRFQQGSAKTLAIFFVLLVLLTATLGGLYFSVRRWLAENNFAKTVMLSNASANKDDGNPSTPFGAEKRDEVLNGVYSSIIDNPYEVRYFRVLSQVLFQKLNDVFAEINARTGQERQPKAEESTLIQNLTVRTINAVQQAGRLDSNNVDIMVEAGESYRNLVPLVQGSEDLAIQSYEKAMVLEPINPFIKTQLGQLYLIKSNLFNQQAVVDKDLVAKSRGVLEEALKLNPNYANARYFLALIQDKAGAKKEALENFKILKSTNPDNKLIAQIIANLEQGLPALGVPPQPATPPSSLKAQETKGVPSK